MLDAPHRLVLGSVARGDDDPESPALDNLIATGLVERVDGAFRVTSAGEAALSAGAKKPWEKWALAVAAIAGVVIVVAELS